MMNTVALPCNSEGERRGVWSRESCLRDKEEKKSERGRERSDTLDNKSICHLLPVPPPHSVLRVLRRADYW